MGITPLFSFMLISHLFIFRHLKLPLFEHRRCGERFLWFIRTSVRHVQRHDGNDVMIKIIQTKSYKVSKKNTFLPTYKKYVFERLFQTLFSSLDLQQCLGSLQLLNALVAVNCGVESDRFGVLASNTGHSSSHQHSSTTKTVTSSNFKGFLLLVRLRLYLLNSHNKVKIFDLQINRLDR